MATTDDVYNYLTGTINPKLDAILAQVVPAGWALGDPTLASWAKLGGDQLLVSSPAWMIYQLWNGLMDGSNPNSWAWQIDSGNVGGLANYLFDLHNLYSILTGDFPADIAAELLPDTSFYALIFKAVYKTWTAT